ncbi:MAG TPA: pyruvate kinase [Gemmatimonadales bacterium]|nr:pyruvate kinase [Gemmatimonadales bacterium]
MKQQRIPRTKIVCTLGPSSDSPEGIRALIEEGLDVARINFSHGTQEQHARTVRRVREIAGELDRPVAILGDLQGPRIRIGELHESQRLDIGQEVRLVFEENAREGDIPVTYAHLADDVQAGDRILINDGLIELVAYAIADGRVLARVLHGGEVSSHKGLNLPGVDVSASSLTDKDRADIAFAIEHELDFLALSFVRRASDIEELRELIPSAMLVVAKIEKDNALSSIEAIVSASDAVMVARGDLGVELPFEEVPLAQKRIIAVANRLARPVITATQMLESMITHPRPTRAEASDVANAILDGTDAVMLSAETAAGAFPRLAVAAMRRIILEVEEHSPNAPREERRKSGTVASTSETIAVAAQISAAMTGAPAIVPFTKSGVTARVVASRRPAVPIVALTDDQRVYRQLALVWGAIPVLVAHCDHYDEMWGLARAAVQRLGIAAPGDRVIVTAGVPFDVPGTTNLLKFETV